MTVVIMHMIEPETVNWRSFVWLQTIGSLLLWLRLLFFMRMFDTTSFLYNIFKHSLTRIVGFMFFFLVILFGCVDSLFKLNMVFPKDKRPFNDYKGAFLLTYKIALGDLALSENFFNDTYLTDDRSRTALPAFIILVVLITIIFTIILLNVLISIVSEVYVEDTSSAK
jgi:hypothetical protein